MFNQDALFKGYKKRLESLPKAKPGSEATRMVSRACVFVVAMRLRAEGWTRRRRRCRRVISRFWLFGGTVPYPTGSLPGFLTIDGLGRSRGDRLISFL